MTRTEPPEGSRVVHGTRSMYTYYNCRCDLCRDAHRAYSKARYKRRSPRQEPEHGTSARYSRGCRCEACRGAHFAKDRASRALRRAAIARGEIVVGSHGAAGWRSGCRCAECKAGHAAQKKIETAARVARGHRRADGTEPEHGKGSTARNYLCRCDLCHEALREDNAKNRARRKERLKELKEQRERARKAREETL